MNYKNLIKGSIVAIITPMYEDGTIDLVSLKLLLDWHIKLGTDAVLVVGTSGESSTLNTNEKCILIKTTVEHIHGRIPVIAGTGSNSTCEAIELSKYAKSVGVDAILQIVPYYNKPEQEGIYQHFHKIAETIDLPIIIYNVPKRTVTDISNETVLKLAQIPNIIGIKDATGDIYRGCKLIKYAPSNFMVFSGDDLTSVPLMLLGANGTFSVTANIIPDQIHTMCHAAINHDIKLACNIYYKLLSLHHAMFIETNPIPVKWGLYHLGKINSGIRLPLNILSIEHQKILSVILKENRINS